MKTNAPFLLCLALTLAAGCTTSSDFTSSETAPAGAMSYTAYDETGRTVVTGWIRLEVPVATGATAAAVTGEWQLHALVDPDLVGLQDGHGVLEGDFHEGDLVVALHPGMIDGGCFLVGLLTTGGGPAAARMSYAGTWNDQSITGPRHHGTFQAK